LNIGLVTALCFWVGVNGLLAKELTSDDIFPTDRVLDVQITVTDEDWDTIRYQSRDFFSALHESRKIAPPEAPYTYVDASVTIDGVAFPNVGLRKKGFLGSQNTTRPSLKIKLNHTDKNAGIEGLTNLTLNNNQQDSSLVSQFMGYALFNAAGSPASRCAYAKVTVNGVNLGIYSHVETVRRSMLRRAFGNDNGTLYEGPYVDFYEGWLGSFEKKTGSDKKGRKKIKQLIEVLKGDGENIEQEIGELVDLDSFYTFWAMEGLLGFWDGYSGNNNNFFIYLNPATDKFHFLPWGADSLFVKFSKLKYNPRAPISVKTQGLIAYKLYQLKSGQERYAEALTDILEKQWNEAELLAELDRIETMVTPHLATESKPSFGDKEKRWGGGQTFARALDATREFIRQRRAEISREIANGMPEWKVVPNEPFVMKSDSTFKLKTNSIWRVAQTGDNEAILQHLATGADINAQDRMFGLTPLSCAVLFDQAETAELLIRKGADVNAKGRDGGTPLHGAAFLGQTETAELLIQNGADVNAKNHKGETPSDAAGTDWEATEFVATFLLKIEIDKHKVETGRAEVIELLQQHGATAKTEGGGDELCRAVKSGDLQAVKIQVKNGVDVNARDSEFGVTALSWAALQGHTKIAEFLIERGTDVNAKNQDGATALHSAAFLGRAEIAKLLIQKGADVNAKNQKGETASDSTAFDWQTTQFVAGFLLKIEVDEKTVNTGRAKIAELLREHSRE
jgi:ankyrin repeat protein/spore coat protein CotH